jgi:hypothetical protein
MQVSQTQLLALEVIARLWAAELRGTPLEEHPEGLLNRMRLAFATGELSAADPAARPLQKAAYELLTALARSGRYTDPTLGQALSYQIHQVKISRAEFARWVQEQGYPPPTFWDGSEPTVPTATSRGAKLMANSTSQSMITADSLDLNGRHYEEMAELIGQLLDQPQSTIREHITALNSVCDLLPAYWELVTKHGGNPEEIFRGWDLDPHDVKGRTYKEMAKLIGQLLDQMEDPKSTTPEHIAALNLLSELLPVFWELYPMGVSLKKHGRDPDKNPRVPAATTTEPSQNEAHIEAQLVIGPNGVEASYPRAGSQTPNLTHRKRGRKRSKESMEATRRLEAAVNSDPALLARLPTLSDKELAKYCGCDQRHHIRTARNNVLNNHATK